MVPLLFSRRRRSTSRTSNFTIYDRVAEPLVAAQPLMKPTNAELMVVEALGCAKRARLTSATRGDKQYAAATAGRQIHRRLANNMGEDQVFKAACQDPL